MLYREIIAVCSQIHTKHINTLCGQNAEMLYVEPGGMYSDHCAVHTVTTAVLTLSCAHAAPSAATQYVHIILQVTAHCTYRPRKGRTLRNKDHLLHASRNVIKG